MNQILLVAVSLLAFGQSATAQTVTPVAPSTTLGNPVAPPASSPPVSPGLRLPMDTRVIIELLETVRSDNRIRGAKFGIKLALPIVIDGQTVVPAGAVGEGEVVYTEHAGMGGAAGKLVLAARYLDVGAQRIKLKALNLAEGGQSNFQEAMVAAAVIGIPALVITGHNVNYPAGTRARAKIAEDVVLPRSEPSAAAAQGASAPASPPVAPSPVVQSTPAPPQP